MEAVTTIQPPAEFQQWFGLPLDSGATVKMGDLFPTDIAAFESDCNPFVNELIGEKRPLHSLYDSYSNWDGLDSSLFSSDISCADDLSSSGSVSSLPDDLVSSTDSLDDIFTTDSTDESEPPAKVKKQSDERYSLSDHRSPNCMYPSPVQKNSVPIIPQSQKLCTLSDLRHVIGNITPDAQLMIKSSFDRLANGTSLSNPYTLHQCTQSISKEQTINMSHDIFTLQLMSACPTPMIMPTYARPPVKHDAPYHPYGAYAPYYSFPCMMVNNFV